MAPAHRVPCMVALLAAALAALVVLRALPAPSLRPLRIATPTPSLTAASLPGVRPPVLPAPRIPTPPSRSAPQSAPSRESPAARWLNTLPAALAVLAAGVAVRLLAPRAHSALTMAAAEEEPRPGWDDRVSIMDQMPDMKSLSAADFSNVLVNFLKQRYGEKETQRVVTSFRRTERGDEYKKVMGSHPLMKQVASSYVKGLTALPMWKNPAARYPWAATLQDGWQVVREELEEAINLGEEGLKERGSLGWVGAPMGAEVYGAEWKALGLCDRGYWDEDNTRLFKNTCRLLRKSRAPIVDCFFARLPPHTEVKAHTDNTNFVLTAHLGLIVPEGTAGVNVGDARAEWKDGELALLDTSFLNEVANTGDRDAYALILRVWHPELTAAEIQAVGFLFDTLEDSDIILHPDGQAMYDMMKAHRLMEWNAILGPGDTEEESAAIYAKMAAAQAEAVASGDTAPPAEGQGKKPDGPDPP